MRVAGDRFSLKVSSQLLSDYFNMMSALDFEVSSASAGIRSALGTRQSLF